MQGTVKVSPSLDVIRQTIRQHIVSPEEQCVESLLAQNPLTSEQQQQVESTALDFVEQCRANPDKQDLFDAFLQEYSLSSQEGVVLMCLAEALLRVPDSYTVDRLIAEKIHLGEWGKHVGKSTELLVNAASAGLVLTSKILNKKTDTEHNPETWFRKLIGRVGEPVVRHATIQAMKFMGQQYVLGRDIEEAAKRGRKENPAGTRFSFDMLGEGARTYADAEKYYQAYMRAIKSIGEQNKHSDICLADGISVKLSALHPRYEFSHHQLVIDELVPSILALAKEAKKLNIGLTIDAEEAARLDIELDVFQTLAFSPELAGWDGLGFVLQAYQKRAIYVVDWLVELAKLTDRKLKVRLVKGAYWDAEIKHAQEMGFEEFPVFTRKVNTDLSYQVCAGKLLANRDVIFPQFATHNAYTVTLIMQMAGDNTDSYEFQRLHGMGELLYKQIAKSIGKSLPLRVYAPVGVHKDLLPYLVRRLLENGANGSFVNQFLDGKVPAINLVKGVESTIESLPGNRNTQIPLANDIFVAYGEKRENSRGVDLDDPVSFAGMAEEINNFTPAKHRVGPIVNGQTRLDEAYPICSPADKNLVVGFCTDANASEVELALQSAHQAQPAWQALGASERADKLDKLADLLEEQTESLTALISYEAGRTLGDGVSEVREAVDFCRYYALQARLLDKQFANQPGLTQGKGVFVCISPWNFPLAIFVGQVVAGLVAGNTVVAKPAEQTPIIASIAVQLMHQAGIPVEAVQLLTGTGAKIGPQLMASPLVAGVAFTGSTETAQRIQQDLVKRGGDMPPFIAETGGQNVMIVDSTALPEQVVDSVIQSAFLSAGQRCSALRVLYLQQDIADNVIAMLKGAINTLKIGFPWKLASDIGPVIDQKALGILQDHQKRMLDTATLVCQGSLSDECENGSFVVPQVYELSHINQLKREVFGPILHIIRFKADQIDRIIQDVNATGYGLTLGVHSRIKQFSDHVFFHTKVGNTYINRNMVGAVVGVNPFGGHGLSGTGFKAGGPHYLLRFSNLWASVPMGEKGEEPKLDSVSLSEKTELGLAGAAKSHELWERTAINKRSETLTRALDAIAKTGKLDKAYQAICADRINTAQKQFSTVIELPGPTGETNELSLHGRGVVLLIADQQSLSNGHAFIQLFSALAAGNAIVMIGRDQATQDQLAELLTTLAAVLPKDLVVLAQSTAELNPLLLADAVALVACAQPQGIWPILAKRTGAIIQVVDHVQSVFALLPYAVEKTKTNNIVATGGNAMLLNLKEG
ncbi:bifunctional proline dehydrogenase/L-glutamate gamma-semialdehyde dehydrogenase PutA [Paraglaciecola aestuariivivens]